MRRTTTRFLILCLRLILQVIGTYYVCVRTAEQIANIPSETWKMVWGIIAIVVILIAVWGYTILDAVRGEKKKPKAKHNNKEEAVSESSEST